MHGGGLHSSANLDTSLNLVPVIDCFVMLICFLLFTAAFTQLVFLDAKITTNTALAMAKSRTELDKFHLIVALSDTGFQIKMSGTEAKTETRTIPHKGGAPDFDGLHATLVQIKTAYPDRFSVDVEIRTKTTNSVSYEALTKVMDVVRHLNEQEFGTLKAAQKKLKSIPLNRWEENLPITPEMERLAQSISGNAIASATDTKLLFPDIALIGVE